jgi:hypothetical protein
VRTAKRCNLGPVYATTLAALSLQVYYRFLPTYKPIEVKEEVEAQGRGLDRDHLTGGRRFDRG